MTVDLADVEKDSINIDVIEETNTLNFSGQANGTKYAFSLDMNQEIVKDESAWNLKGRNILINVAKKDKEQEEWWPRITKEKVKNHFITIDFARWIDPDDSGDEKKD